MSGRIVQRSATASTDIEANRNTSGPKCHMNSQPVIAANTLAHGQIKQWKAVDGPHITIVNLATPATLLATELPTEKRLTKIHGLTEIL
jgi:hypothetical protein